jgi:LAO/AO transport system kinase
VARKTRETLLVFEAAGFDVVLIETVGVGQNEIAVRSMVDFFLLVLVPGAGDELQGIKKGVMELADAVAVNKADGENILAAQEARSEYGHALRYLTPATPGWQTKAYTLSAHTGAGVDEIWEVVERFKEATLSTGTFRQRRREQARAWLHQLMEERLHDLFYLHPVITKLLPKAERQVMEGSLPVARAAMELLRNFEEAFRQELRKPEDG